MVRHDSANTLDSAPTIVNSLESSPETAPELEVSLPSGLPLEQNQSMQEYYKLQQDLLKTVFLLGGMIFAFVWFFYSLNVALNYLIGACTGVVYLRMLAKNVEQLGRGKQRISNTRLALLIGLILVASRWDQLQIMPIFLGFLTYKAALIFHVLRTAILPEYK